MIVDFGERNPLAPRPGLNRLDVTRKIPDQVGAGDPGWHRQDLALSPGLGYRHGNAKAVAGKVDWL